jgi:GTP-binding protein
MTHALPNVVLVGRTNVGKSTIFNRLSSDSKSIVFDRDGVTRDHIQEVISWNLRKFMLIDAGGIPVGKNLSEIDQAVYDHVMKLINKADIILFVCDARSGLTAQDEEIAQHLRRSTAPIYLVANKIDNPEKEADALIEFSSTGYKLLPVSALHGRGFGTLLEKIEEHVSQETAKHEEHDHDYRVTIIGKPNVGKSSLLNLLLKEERSIVSSVAGTTRDTVGSTLKLHHQSLELTDTAGIRRGRSIDDPLETMMVKSSFKALKDSDLVVIAVDASQTSISSQELKLLFYAHEQHKAIILVFNKDDLIDEDQREFFLHDLSQYKHITDKIPTLWTSCITEKHISRLRELINQVWQRCSQEFNSTEVNEIVQARLARVPFYHNGHPIKFFKIRNVKAKLPTFVLHVNHPSWVRPDHTSFIEKVIRKSYDLRGCPVRLILRSTSKED